jgi:hypothetical protein
MDQIFASNLFLKEIQIVSRFPIDFIIFCMMRGMQKESEAFKSNFNYYQCVAHKKVIFKNFLSGDPF